MDTRELERLIRHRRAAFRAFTEHDRACVICRAWDGQAEAHKAYAKATRRLGREPSVNEWEVPAPKCAEHARLWDGRMALNEMVTTAARALGYNSATAYERARYGKVGGVSG